MKKRVLALLLIFCMSLIMLPAAYAAEIVYPISAVITGEGKVTTEDPVSAAGETVDIAIKPDKGYELYSFEVTDYFGNYIETEQSTDGTYSFIMPENKVTITVVFKAAGAIDENDDPFTDVPKRAPYYDAVKFVYEEKLMLGVEGGLFAPDLPISRGMLVTMLYRLEGEPQAYYENTFSDVTDDMYCRDAVIWAQKSNVVTGYKDDLFGPDDHVTREQAAVILWRYAGRPDAHSDLSEFFDREYVSDYAVCALAWAVESDMLVGRDKNLIAARESATRAQVAVMFWQYLGAEK